jgi:Holliday junction DNA helicase RuvA
VRAIKGRDLAVLSSVNGIGRKKAERLALELSDRFDDIEITAATPVTRSSEEAVRALVALGYTPAAADDAVRIAAREVALEDTPQLIRRALAQLVGARPGRSI